VEFKDALIPTDDFYKMRSEVLGQWETGQAAKNLEEGFYYQSTLPESKRFSNVLDLAKAQHKTLIQPRAGVPLIDEHIRLLAYLQDHSEVDLLPTTIDSYTRQNRYEKAQVGIEESIKTGMPMLNGFPAVNHGVHGCRQVVEAVDLPLQVRHGTPDARLLAEISYMSGFTSYEGGGISYNIPYVKNIDLETTIRNWQYVDRLTGIYGEAGIALNREPFGPLTGTLVPPCISHSVAIIESLLAARQGVKHITVGYGQCGNLVQDIAALRSLDSLTNAYLREHGFEDVAVTTVLHQWMGGFPADDAQAFSVIALGSAIGALAKATKIIVKTPHEALGIPTMEANAQGLRATKQMISMLEDQFLKTEAIEAEAGIIAAETRCILDACFWLGEGDFAVGTVRAFESGVIDIPFAPSRYNAGKVLTARDNDGAIRFFKHGDIPLSDDLLAFHQDKIQERARSEGRLATFQMVIDDVYAISKGRLVGRPK